MYVSEALKGGLGLYIGHHCCIYFPEPARPNTVLHLEIGVRELLSQVEHKLGNWKRKRQTETSENSSRTYETPQKNN